MPANRVSILLLQCDTEPASLLGLETPQLAAGSVSAKRRKASGWGPGTAHGGAGTASIDGG
jgi:hypothetical protein